MKNKRAEIYLDERQFYIIKPSCMENSCHEAYYAKMSEGVPAMACENSKRAQTLKQLSTLISKCSTEELMYLFLYHHLLFPRWDMASDEFNVMYQQFKSEINRDLSDEQTDTLKSVTLWQKVGGNSPKHTLCHTEIHSECVDTLEHFLQSSTDARRHKKEPLVASSRDNNPMPQENTSHQKTSITAGLPIPKDKRKSPFSVINELTESHKFFPHHMSLLAKHDPLMYLMLKVWHERDTSQSVVHMHHAMQFAERHVPHCQMWFLWFCMGRAVPQAKNSLDCYAKALELNPKSALSFYNRGLLCDEMQLYDEARRCYALAMQHDPSFCDAANNLGTLYKDHYKMPEEARQCYEQALAHNSTYVYALNNLGLLYDEMKEPHKAFEFFTRCIRVAPHYGLSFYNRANLFENHCMFREALKDYTRSLERNSQHVKSWNNRAVVHESLNMLREAVLDYSRAIEVSPDEEQSSLARENLRALRKRLATEHCIGNI